MPQVGAAGKEDQEDQTLINSVKSLINEGVKFD